MILIIIFLLLLWFFQIVFLESFYIKIKVNDVRNQTLQLVKMLDEKEEFREAVDEFAFKGNLSIEFLNLDGTVIYQAGWEQAGNQMMMMRNREKNEVFSSIIEGGETSFTLSHPRFGMEYLILGLPVVIGDSIEGAVFVHIPKAPVEETAGILKRQLLIITFVIFILSLIISFTIADSMTKPVLIMKKATEKIASGNFDARVSIKSKDELGQLAESINLMGENLGKTDKLRKELTANVSHELRTPISLIKGYAETVRDITGKDEEKRKRQLDIIVNESDRLSEMVNEMLMLSRFEAGYGKLDDEIFSLPILVSDICEKYVLTAEKSGIELLCNIEGEGNICGDRKKIGQVLMNLLNNAFNHTPEGGKIIVEAKLSNDLFRVSVSDTGEGIPPEELEYVWDRYYRSRNPNNINKLGSGLGLAIVKSILTVHGAGFGVESIYGSGSSFWFEILIDKN